MNTSIKNIVLLLILSLVWAGVFIFVKVADESLNPYVIMSVRATVSAAFLFTVLPFSGTSLLPYFKQGKTQLLFLLSGAFIAYMWLTIGFSEEYISAAMASLLLSALAPISWLIATFITREKPFYIVNCFGILVATVGIVVMIGYKHILHADHTLWACALYLSGLIAFATAATINKHLLKDILPRVTVSFNVLYMAIILTLAAFIFSDPLAAHFTVRNVSAIVALGILSTGVGYMIYFYLTHTAGLVFASLSTYLVPVFGFILGLTLLAEPLHPERIVGLLIIFVGMWFIQRPVPQ